MNTTLRIDGLRTEPINRRPHWAATRKVRECVRLHVMASKARGRGLPARVTLTRLSAGELDHGAAYEALKPVIDGLADGLGLDDDRDLQRPERMMVRQEKCKRGTCGVVIVLAWTPKPAAATTSTDFRSRAWP